MWNENSYGAWIINLEKKMYIAIFEDGDFKLVESVSDDDFLSVDNGMLDLIDVSVADNPTFYSDGEWKQVK